MYSSECPDYELEPTESPYQEQINLLFDMTQAKDDIISFLSDPIYDKYFHDEIVPFYASIIFKVQELKEKMDGECY